MSDNQNSIPGDLLKKIRRIEIRTDRIVNQSLAGEYKSIFKGRGMEFSEVREYQPGDDVRNIDWNVTARMGSPYVKEFVEERELTIVLLVDASRSLYFGTRKGLKSDVSAELSALLAFSAIKNNDKVGLIMFSDRIEKFIPPGKGKKHVLQLIRDILYFQPEGKHTDIEEALDFFGKVTNRTSVVFLMSDFYDTGYWDPLSIVSGEHDLIGLRILDPIEKKLPKAGIVRLADLENGEKTLIDTSSSEVRERFNKRTGEHREKTRERFNKRGIDLVDIRTDLPYHKPLVNYFRRREEKFRR